MKWMSQQASAAIVIACGVLTTSCASVTSAPDVTAEQRTVEHFRREVDDYMELRGKAADEVGRVESSFDPSEILADRRTLANEIRRRRADAKQGDIFVPEVRTYFRVVLSKILQGDHSQNVRARLSDDAPDPGAVPLQINAPYPPGLSFPTTPTPILRALPTLPPAIEYRIVGRDLILLDAPAGLVIDYMRNALPVVQNLPPGTQR